MESSSIIYTSPSFNTHSSNNTVDIADRVVQELRSVNLFNEDDVFIFRDDDHEFEFPSCQASTGELLSGDQISPRYPLFDKSLLSESELNLNLCNDVVVTSKTHSMPPPATRCSLMKLLKEDCETASPSTSSLDRGDLDGLTPETYCVWKPKAEPRGKHKKSNSISIGNTSNRWKVRDLHKRSYSDDNYYGKDLTMLLLVPPISQEKINMGGKSVRTASAVGDGVVSTKSEKKIPAYKSKIGNIRLPPYLPYRQDQVPTFANVNGSNKKHYHYY